MAATVAAAVEAAAAAAVGPQLRLRFGGPACARLLTCAALLVIAAATGLPYFLIADDVQANRVASLGLAARYVAESRSPSYDPPTLLDEDRISAVHSAKFNRVAICLVGGARMFELTGRTIKQHVLRAFEAADVLVNVPLDENTHKMTALLGAQNLVSLRIFAQTPIWHRGAPQAVLRASGSPNGLQGLLQYFNLVEGCLKLISDREATAGVSYSWVLRTRVDTFWTGPPHTLAAYNPRKYTVPHGCTYGGYNDRFGMGDMNTSSAALARLSLLPKIQRAGYRSLNSEQALRAQLEVCGVAVAKVDLPFCVLSLRRYAWPLRPSGVQVVSLSSRGFMNGAKCRPCKPVAVGDKALALVRAADSGWADRGDGVELCNPSGPWEAGWEAIFDAAAGPEAAAVRRDVDGRGYGRCVVEMAALQGAAAAYDGPTPELICLRGFLGAPSILGSGNGQWPAFLDGSLGNSSVVYSGGIGEDLFWELTVAGRYNCIVHAFDATPLGSPWAQQFFDVHLAPNNVFIHDACLGAHDGNATARAVLQAGRPVGTFTVLPAIAAPYELGPEQVAVQVTTLAAAMAGLGHARVDVLKLSVEGAEFDMIEAWGGRDAPPRVCQLLVSFATRWLGAQGKALRDAAVTTLQRLGLELVSCVQLADDGSASKCVFLSPSECKSGMFQLVMES
eukprot:SM000306S11734  [mRNA]  locus=s306:17180:19779:+ [translate_table: standard]